MARASPAPLFSIVTVTYNCAQAVSGTIASIQSQSFRDYEHVVKDGGSTDGTLEEMRRLGVSHLVSEPDAGIYDAMNRAVGMCRGQYVYFLNAGDTFAGPDVLQRVAEAIHREACVPFWYGDVLTMQPHPVYGAGRAGQGRLLRYPERFTRLLAYLVSVCHQSWFVARALYRRYPFDLSFRIKADHDFFLHWILEAGIEHRHVAVPVVIYAAGGESERRRALLHQEHKRLLKRYYSPTERIGYWLIQKGWQAYRVGRFYMRGELPPV